MSFFSSTIVTSPFFQARRAICNSLLINLLPAELSGVGAEVIVLIPFGYINLCFGRLREYSIVSHQSREYLLQLSCWWVGGVSHTFGPSFRINSYTVPLRLNSM